MKLFISFNLIHVIFDLIAKEHVNWLLNNDGPWSSVLIHWQLSVKIRQSEFKRPSETLKVIFDKYSILKQPLGYELVYMNKY